MRRLGTVILHPEKLCFIRWFRLNAAASTMTYLTHLQYALEQVAGLEPAPRAWQAHVLTTNTIPAYGTGYETCTHTSFDTAF